MIISTREFFFMKPFCIIIIAIFKRQSIEESLKSNHSFIIFSFPLSSNNYTELVNKILFHESTSNMKITYLKNEDSLLTPKLKIQITTSRNEHIARLEN